MADLRVPEIDDQLMAKLKAEAALARVTLKQFVEAVLADAMKRRAAKKTA